MIQKPDNHNVSNYNRQHDVCLTYVVIFTKLDGKSRSETPRSPPSTRPRYQFSSTISEMMTVFPRISLSPSTAENLVIFASLQYITVKKRLAMSPSQSWYTIAYARVFQAPPPSVLSTS